nr:MAG TPA: hypothetical protein [Caudoviricetes sp.]
MRLVPGAVGNHQPPVRDMHPSCVQGNARPHRGTNMGLRVQLLGAAGADRGRIQEHYRERNPEHGSRSTTR